ncbi:MAG: trypsin-like peptidase domain-containing protein, partial [Candidatus Nanohaloarchaea archaeon]
MKAEYSKRNSVIIALIFAFVGAMIGSGVMYHSLNDDVQALNSQVDNIQNRQQNIYVNDTGVAFESIFNRTGASVVYLNTEDSRASGFVYSKNGHIVTNQHAVEGSSKIEVSFTDGVTKRAEVIGQDPYTDLAVLKVDKSGLQPLNFSDSTKVRVGQTAIAIGNPFGLDSSMTQGIISQTGRSIRVEGGFSIRNVIQTDAAINPGNSGGPLLNREGKVVGVNTAIETQSGGFQGVGFAIPANTVKRVVPKLISEGEYEHPWIGVRGRDVTPGIAEEMNLQNSSGFLVLEVVNKSPAAQANLKPSTRTVEIEGNQMLVGGDVIVGMNG